MKFLIFFEEKRLKVTKMLIFCIRNAKKLKKSVDNGIYAVYNED